MLLLLRTDVLGILKGFAENLASIMKKVRINLYEKR